MITHTERGLRRVTLTLEATDVDLLDRLAVLDGSTRSSLTRSLLEQVRPTLKATVEAFEAANASRDAFMAEAARLGEREMSALLPELERLRSGFIGAMSRIEGAATAHRSEEA